MYFIGRPFWHSRLNLIDIIVVVTGLTEAIIIALVDGSILNLKHTRLLRLAKMARMARGYRILKMPKLFDGLRILVEAIRNSMAALLWSMVVLVVIQCVAGMTLSQMVFDFL